jgi:hypothetical protein
VLWHCPGSMERGVLYIFDPGIRRNLTNTFIVLRCGLFAAPAARFLPGIDTDMSFSEIYHLKLPDHSSQVAHRAHFASSDYGFFAT